MMSSSKTAPSSSDSISITTSECAPQPYSTETTWPSALEITLAHTPKPARNEPASGTKNAQVPQCAGA
jgi:hypothetical protein